jgi:hypothetical protein
MSYLNKNLNFTGVVIIIYSCTKYIQRANLLYNLIKRLNSPKIKIFIINGKIGMENEYEIQHHYLYLKCLDNYESLWLKTKKLMKEIINIFPKMEGIIKIDDDMFPNINFFEEMIGFISNKFINYCGRAMLNKRVNVVYSHIDKCDNPGYKKPLTTPICIFCPGPCYYLSNKAIRFFNENCKDFFLEDMMIGYTFTNTKIKTITYPTYYDNKLYQWNTNVQNGIDKFNHGLLTFIKLHGGMGNQLFQVAAGIKYCEKNNSLPVLIYENDQNKHHYYPHSDEQKILDIIFKNFNKLTLKELIGLNYNLQLIKPESEFLDAYKKYDLKPISNLNIFLDGYFQNKEYISDRNELQNLFIDDKKIELVESLFEDVHENYFIHIRRGDYVGKSQYEINYDIYFKNALKLLFKNTRINHIYNNNRIKVYVLSNDIEYCKTYQVLEDFKDKIDFIFIEKLDEIDSFYLMTLCKGGIISNSSYSWWGSHLNNTPGKIIIMPKFWLPDTNINMGFENVILV